jgi:hypothetical protein
VVVPAVVPGMVVVRLVKNGVSVPTLIIAVWLLMTRMRGWETTLTSPCSSRASSRTRVLLLAKRKLKDGSRKGTPPTGLVTRVEPPMVATPPKASAAWAQSMPNWN